MKYDKSSVSLKEESPCKNLVDLMNSKIGHHLVDQDTHQVLNFYISSSIWNSCDKHLGKEFGDKKISKEGYRYLGYSFNQNTQRVKVWSDLYPSRVLNVTIN
jgi:hypothetical protein